MRTVNIMQDIFFALGPLTGAFLFFFKPSLPPSSLLNIFIFRALPTAEHFLYLLKLIQKGKKKRKINK